VADEPSGSEEIWEQDQRGQRQRARRGRVVALASCLALVVVGVGLMSWAGRRTGDVRIDAGPATRRVISALGTTVAATRWDMTFRMSFVPGGSDGAFPARGVTISGHGTTNVDPFAMVAYATVGGVGSVTTEMNGTEVWEFAGGNYGAQPGPSASAPGASIAGFAPVVEGTLGSEEGAVAMMGLGSATGYLDLVREAVVAARATGTGTLNGVPVTYYRVSVDPTKLLSQSGSTPQEDAAVQAALQLLSDRGYEGITDAVAVDGDGHIRELTEVVPFADGGVVTSESAFSDFGCAATVVVPGAQSPTTTTAPCPSPR